MSWHGEPPHTVESIKIWLAKQDRPGLALDIDDTLCITGRYWYDKLIEVAGDPGVSFEEIVSRYKRFQHVPGWSEDPRVKQWIDDAIHKSRHDLFYVRIENSKERLDDIMRHVTVHAYFTMRPTTSLESTVGWLRLYGFPELPILARPTDISNEEMRVWKGKALGELYPHISGIIDDDPHVIQEVPPGYQGTIFLFGDRTQARTDLKVVRCRDWDEVYEKTKPRLDEF